MLLLYLKSPSNTKKKIKLSLVTEQGSKFLSELPDLPCDALHITLPVSANMAAN